MVKPRQIPLSPPHGACAEPGWLLTLFKPLANNREPKTRSVAVNFRVPCPSLFNRQETLLSPRLTRCTEPAWVLPLFKTPRDTPEPTTWSLH